MSKIKDIANTEFDELLEYVNLGELNVIKLSTDEQYMSE